MVTCPQCQTSYEDEVSFCTRDGTSLGSAEALDDECSTSISDAPPDLEDILDLSSDLNAVEANEAEISEWQDEKAKNGHQVGAEALEETQSDEEEFEVAKSGTKSGWPAAMDSYTLYNAQLNEALQFGLK